MEFHKYADLLPMMTETEFADLKEDIKNNGQIVPVYLFESKILDGRHRFRACSELGVEPKFEEYTGSDPIGFVLSLNLKRRHLTESQRGMIAHKIKAMFEEDAKKNMLAGKANPALNSGQGRESRSDHKAAKMLNVGHAIVYQASKVNKDGAPEVIEAVEKGDIKLNSAVDIVKLPKQEQVKTIRQGKEAVSKKVKELRRRGFKGELVDIGAGNRSKIVPASNVFYSDKIITNEKFKKAWKELEHQIRAEKAQNWKTAPREAVLLKIKVLSDIATYS